MIPRDGRLGGAVRPPKPGWREPEDAAVPPRIVVGHAAGEPIRLIVAGLCYKRTG